MLEKVGHFGLPLAQNEANFKRFSCMPNGKLQIFKDNIFYNNLLYGNDLEISKLHLQLIAKLESCPKNGLKNEKMHALTCIKNHFGKPFFSWKKFFDDGVKIPYSSGLKYVL